MEISEEEKKYKIDFFNWSFGFSLDIKDPKFPDATGSELVTKWNELHGEKLTISEDDFIDDSLEKMLALYSDYLSK